MALTVQGWGSKKKKVTTTGGRELLAKRKKEREERDSKKTTRIKTIRGEKVTQWWDNEAKRWVNKRPARPSKALGATEQKTKLKIKKAEEENKDSSKSKQTPYVDPDAADKKDEEIFRSSSSGKVAKERHAKKEKLAIEKDKNRWGKSKQYQTKDGNVVDRSNVFTKHYKTGKQLGVMTRNQRRAYDKAAAAHIRDKNKNKKNGK